MDRVSQLDAACKRFTQLADSFARLVAVESHSAPPLLHILNAIHEPKDRQTWLKAEPVYTRAYESSDWWMVTIPNVFQRAAEYLIGLEEDGEASTAGVATGPIIIQEPPQGPTAKAAEIAERKTHVGSVLSGIRFISPTKITYNKNETEGTQLPILFIWAVLASLHGENMEVPEWIVLRKMKENDATTADSTRGFQTDARKLLQDIGHPKTIRQGKGKADGVVRLKLVENAETE